MATYDRDYLTTLPLLKEQAAEFSDGAWNKYNNDVGETLLKFLACGSHTVDYYFRKYLNALFLPNDNWNQKALIWELTGYKPPYIRADYLAVQLYWPDCGLNEYVGLYQYTPFKIVADGVEYTFLCAEDYLIPPLTTRINIRLVNGTLETINQDYTQIKNNKIKLCEDDIDYDLVSVIVSGETWTQVRNVFYSPDTERIYSLHKEEDGTYLYLHSTWAEWIDTYDTSFTIYFVKSVTDFDMYTDECMSVTFSEPLYDMTGVDVSSYYKIIPLLGVDALDATDLVPSTTEGNRAITTLDFESNASLYPGISSCRSYDWNTPTVTNTPFEVVVIACDKSGNLSDHLKTVLKNYLSSICSPLLNVVIEKPLFSKQNLLVVLDIGEYKGTLAEVQLKLIIQREIKAFYDISNMSPGRIVKTTELNSLCLHADSRIYFATVSFLNSIDVNPRLIPQLGTIIVITSAETKNREDKALAKDTSVGIKPLGFDYVSTVDKSSLVIYVHTSYLEKAIVPIDKYPVWAVESNAITKEFNIIDREFKNFDASKEVLDQYQLQDALLLSVIGVDSEYKQKPIISFIFETLGNSSLIKEVQENQSILQTTATIIPETGSIVSLDLKLDVPTNLLTLDEFKTVIINALNSNSDLTFDLDGDGVPDVLTESDLIIAGSSGRSTANLNGLLGDNVEKPTEDNLGVKQGILSGSAGVENLITTLDFGKLKENSEKQVILPNTGTSNVGGIETGELNENFKLKKTSTFDEKFEYLPYNSIQINEYWNNTTLETVLNKAFIITENTETNETLNYTLGLYCNSVTSISAGVTGEPLFKFDCKVVNTIKTTTIVPKDKNQAAEFLLRTFDSTNIVYAVSETTITWYFIKTDALHNQESINLIGTGLKVKINITKSTGVYVDIKEELSCGYIYSAELSNTDLEII